MKSHLLPSKYKVIFFTEGSIVQQTYINNKNLCKIYLKNLNFTKNCYSMNNSDIKVFYIEQKIKISEFFEN